MSNFNINNSHSLSVYYIVTHFGPPDIIGQVASVQWSDTVPYIKLIRLKKSTTIVGNDPTHGSHDLKLTMYSYPVIICFLRG